MAQAATRSNRQDHGGLRFHASQDLDAEILNRLAPAGGIWHTGQMLPWTSQIISRMPLPDRVRSGGMG